MKDVGKPNVLVTNLLTSLWPLTHENSFMGHGHECPSPVHHYIFHS